MPLAGAHTADELAELLAKFDGDLNDLQRQFDGFASAWKAKNPSDESAWEGQWRALRERYRTASDVARKAVNEAKSGFLPMATVRVESEYEGLRRALKRSPDGPFEEGDLQDLYNRLAAAKATPKPGAAAAQGSKPKPKPKPKPTPGPAAPVQVPAVVVVPAQPPPPAPSAASSNVPWIAGGIAALLATALLLKKSDG